MDNLARSRQAMLEAMESCRAESRDLSDPQLAELAAALADDAELRARFERVQATDMAIKAAFADVPVPAGLALRVSRRLVEAAPAQPAEVQLAVAIELHPATAHDSPAPLRPKQAETFSRRRLLVGFAALSASAALLTAVWLHSRQPHPISPQRTIDEAMEFFGHDDAPQGKLAIDNPPPSEFPMSRDIRPSQLVRWRRVSGFLGGEAVAYDLPQVVPGQKATLYVVNRKVAGLSSLPPSSPTMSTGGNSAAAWQSGNLLYVLVVQGDAGTYSQYLDRSTGPLT